MAVDMDVEELLIMGDSNMIIRQAQGELENRDIKLIPYRQHVDDLSKRFKYVEFWYIPRFHIELADALATLAAMLPYPVGATPYLLVYGTEALIPVEVEVPSLRIIVEAEIEDNEWVNTRLEQLTLIDQKWMAAVCHGQLYQQRMARAYKKKVRPRNFEVGQLVLRRILLHHKEAKGKFAPNWKCPYIIRNLLPKGALYLGDIEGNNPEATVNADAVKRYYV
ncbi:PREDICTED: uncharacterized protein LOC109208387 [Nicotiana attenuata]|uniref:uncharacterized protein LOC109208387 n=1 Tax=Nicotiana attenuata TaxID=49451 RepID=UPI000904B229|nr:PREDICTED: uncharacterized protein LOC109208387 [Nicotiana attenuata]